MIEINGVQLEGDWADVDFAENAEDAIQELVKRCEKLKQQTSRSTRGSALMREFCREIDDMFNRVFGDGASEAIFGGHVNFLEHMKAYQEFAENRDNVYKQVNDIANQYVQRNRANEYKANKSRQKRHGKGNTAVVIRGNNN